MATIKKLKAVKNFQTEENNHNEEIDQQNQNKIAMNKKSKKIAKDQ